LQAFPGESVTSTPSPQSKEPASFDLLLKYCEASTVGRHGVVREISAHDRSDPSALFRDAQMSATHQLVLDLRRAGDDLTLSIEHRAAPSPPPIGVVSNAETAAGALES
jgi:hypothetical protein